MNADARFVSFEIFAPDETHVVGRNDGNAAFDGEIERALAVALVAFATGSLQFQVITIAEQVQPEVERLAVRRRACR